MSNRTLSHVHAAHSARLRSAQIPKVHCREPGLELIRGAHVRLRGDDRRQATDGDHQHHPRKRQVPQGRQVHPERPCCARPCRSCEGRHNGVLLPPSPVPQASDADHQSVCRPGRQVSVRYQGHRLRRQRYAVYPHLLSRNPMSEQALHRRGLAVEDARLPCAATMQPPHTPARPAPPYAGVVLISDLLREGLNADVSVLMGANVANDMAHDQFCETTIGYKDEKNGELFRLAFDAPALKVGTVKDTVGVELCGALKNIVAIGAGFSDGLGYGGNTKAALIRIGLKEMIKFCKMFYPNAGIDDNTFLESCGVADLITTCFGGRNRKCAEAYAKANKTKSLEQIEAELLAGQKLQGTLTAKEVNHILKMKGLEHEFPFFTTVYKISYENAPFSALTETPY
eukprot:scaffold27680_cov33-Tisochrysis_lutea.AAC.4